MNVEVQEKLQEYASLIGYDKLHSILERSADANFLSTISNDDLIRLQAEAEILYTFFNSLQKTTKLLCNSVYGGLGTPSLRYFNHVVADDITAEGRAVCQLTEKAGEHYFKNIWHNDVEMQNHMAAKFPVLFEKCTKNSDGNYEVTRIVKPVVYYSDTDSVFSSTIINSSSGNLTIEDLFVKHSNHFRTSENGTEYAKTDLKIKNFTEAKGEYYDNPLLVIRHKVTKAKFKITTESGKELFITGDHSLVVFRDGKKISCKPTEVQPNDKIYSSYGID